MTAPLALIALATFLAFAAIPMLQRAHWPTRSPALGILVWQAASISIFSSLVLAGLTLAVPEIPASEGMAEFFHACTVALRQHYSTPGGVALSLLGGLAAVALLLRFLMLLTRLTRQSRRDRAHHLDLLSVVCRPHPASDVVVVDHDVPAVYCLPGRRHRIVVTRAAMLKLSATELRQVLAHERAHLRARHHLVLRVAEALANTFGQRLGLGAARERIAALAEMHADDAADSTLRTELATALIVLAGGARPASALGASGASALIRVSRLVAPAAPISVPLRRLGVASAAMLFAAPLLLALSPAMMTTLQDYCPIL